MTYALSWMPQVLLDAGLKVAEVDGWQIRGRGEMGEVFGVLCHHTAGIRKGNMPSLRTLVEGRPDLQGPLAQLGLGRDGTYYIIAAGRANHAGSGIWNGITEGNTHFIGIEAENTGRPDDLPWPAVQMDALRHGVAAILKQIGCDASFCAGHKEYALPKGRKSDPNFEMQAFRLVVCDIMNGGTPPLVPIPPVEPGPAGRPTLRRGSQGEFVKRLQRLLSLEADGDFGAKTEAAIREFQRQCSLVPDGIVGPKSWVALDRYGVNVKGDAK